MHQNSFGARTNTVSVHAASHVLVHAPKQVLVPAPNQLRACAELGFGACNTLVQVGVSLGQEGDVDA